MGLALEHLQRDFVGYGAKPVDPAWPGQARLALNFVLNYEEGSEPSIQDGENYSEAALTDARGLNPDRVGRDLAAESLFEYGSRVGFWRLMRLFRDRDLPLTIFACALAMERNPQAAAAIRAAGHDVCSHGWRWISHSALSEDEERRHIRMAIESLERTTGSRPTGWYCRYSPGPNTRRLVVEAGGFEYDSDYYGDELPFWRTVDGKPHLIVPYSLTNNDGQFNGAIGNADQWFSHVRDCFDMLYEEGATQPKMMSVGLHMRLIGHPSRAAGLARFLDHVKKYDDVWVARRVDIARHWKRVHPYSGKGLNE